MVVLSLHALVSKCHRNDNLVESEKIFLASRGRLIINVLLSFVLCPFGFVPESCCLCAA